MKYTKSERERYNEDRKRKCGALGITKNQYNWLRRKGEELHKVYEDNCNGVIESEEKYFSLTSAIEKSVHNYLLKQKLYKTDNKKVYFVYFQTDPRGATIYLDTKKIPENNYTQAVCIY